MSKMAKRRRKRKKTCKTISNLMKLLENMKVRVPSPPVGVAFKSEKDYNRSKNKKIIKDDLNES